jgi:hypothetical protein
MAVGRLVAALYRVHDQGRSMRVEVTRLRVAPVSGAR